jgi:hypothetical protein
MINEDVAELVLPGIAVVGNGEPQPDPVGWRE